MASFGMTVAEFIEAISVLAFELMSGDYMEVFCARVVFQEEQIPLPDQGHRKVLGPSNEDFA